MWCDKQDLFHVGMELAYIEQDLYGSAHYTQNQQLNEIFNPVLLFGEKGGRILLTKSWYDRRKKMLILKFFFRKNVQNFDRNKTKTSFPSLILIIYQNEQNSFRERKQERNGNLRKVGGGNQGFG